MKKSATLIILSGIFIFCASGALAKGDPAKGKKVYLRLCGHCHGKNPSWGNFKAPALTGSSRKLLEARIMRAEYPPGYKPKKTTKEMPAFPREEPNIDHLFAFLNQ